MEQLLGEMTWNQFHDWFDYAQLEPFGLDRIDLGFAQVCSVVANTAFGRSKGARVFSPQDFLPDYEKEIERQEKRKPLTDLDEWEKTKSDMAMLYGSAER